MSWLRERRFARRVAQRCSCCLRYIDEEDYTRTLMPQSNAHKRGFDVLIECRDCRNLEAA